jgi:tetratricopeptide (TPR) repeat protein
MARLSVLAAAAVVAISCGGAARPRMVAWPDAPIQLRDEADRDAAIDRLWVMPPGPERERERTAIATALIHRIADAVREGRSLAAAQLLDELIGLWHGDPGGIRAGLAAHLPLLRELRGVFARTGALGPAAQTLVVLAEVEPAARGTHLAELDEVLAFADDLAVAENGPEAVRAQPIAILQPTVLALPLPWLADRYVDLLVERQAHVATALERESRATIELVRAHHDILATSRRIANALARGGREVEIAAQLGRIKGIGTDRELRARADALAERPSAATYAELASMLRSDDDNAADPGAALAVGLAGLAKYPDDPKLLAGAGGDARALGRIDQAIELHEAALRNSVEIDATLALRLGKLYGDRITRLASAGRPHAADRAWREAIAFTASAARQHPSVVWQQAAALAESALGKGLASQGLVDAGRRALTASLERAPSTDAYETLSTIDVQIDRFRDAQKWAIAGIALLGNTTTGDRYRRAKLERLAADALRRAGKSREAATRYLDSLRSWASLGESKALPRSIVAERLLESGRAMWWLGDAARAIDLVSEAVDADPDSPAIAAGAVAFLIEAGRYRDALDAYHRGLGEPGIAELYKVYMSLWIVAEGKRRAEPRDRLATEYLASRRGDLWYEQLARAASGTLPYEALAAAANTGPRRGELAFYGAVLDLDPAAATPAGRKRLLEEVVRARAVLDAEYDLARLYLASP